MRKAQFLIALFTVSVLCFTSYNRTDASPPQDDGINITGMIKEVPTFVSVEATIPVTDYMVAPLAEIEMVEIESPDLGTSTGITGWDNDDQSYAKAEKTGFRPLSPPFLCS